MYASIELQKDFKVEIGTRNCLPSNKSLDIWTPFRDASGDYIGSDSVYIYGTPDQLRQIAQNVLSQLLEDTNQSTPDDEALQDVERNIEAHKNEPAEPIELSRAV